MLSIRTQVGITVLCGRGSSRVIKRNSLSPFKPTEQKLQRRRRGQRRSAAPIASEHDPGFQPASHCSQGRWPGDLWPHGFSRADFFPPFLLQQPEHCSAGELLTRMANALLAWCSQRGERHDTSKRRRRSRPVASAVGWPCRFAPGTATSPYRRTTSSRLAAARSLS